MKDTKQLIDELNEAIDMQHEIILGMKDLLVDYLKQQEKDMVEYRDALRITKHK